MIIAGLVLILVLCGGEASPHLINFVKGYVPPPRTTTGLKEIVDSLTAATPPELRVDTDNDTIYDCVENVIGTDFNNSDTDFDMLNDYTEVQLDSDPLDPDTNNDGITDYNEITNVPPDVDGDGVTNIWDYDNDGDGVPDSVDMSPFSASVLSGEFHFDVATDGKPTYVTLQFRPRNPENLKLYYQLWDWPNDTEGSMKDLDGSLEDLRVVPQLNVTVNVKPNQTDVAELGIVVTDYGMYVPVFPVWDNDDIVAFSAQIFYNSTAPLNLSMDAELIWQTLGYRDEYAKAVKAYNDRYVSATAGGGVVANATEVTSLEKFQWIELGEDQVALKLQNGPYLSVADNGTVMANGYEIGSSEMFRLLYPTNASLCLEAANGQCVAVSSDGTLVADGSNTTASARFELINKGCLGEWSNLATYHDVIMLTGFTVSESYGTDLGLFYSADEQQTIRANLLMSYDFLRNSTNHLSDMPAVLSRYGSDVSSLVGSFSTCDEAVVTMSNTLLPTVLDSLPANQVLPVLMGVEETVKAAEMSEFPSATNVTGNHFDVNLTAEEFMTTKTLKLNFYNTTGYQALEIDDILRHINTWSISEEAQFNTQTLVLAWNMGEQTITTAGTPDLSSAGQPEWFVAFPMAFESMMLLARGGVGLKAYQALKNLSKMGWNSGSIARLLKTGSNAGGFSLWAKMCQKITKVKEGFAGLKGLNVLKKAMKGLEVLGVMVDVGLSILTGFLIADQIGGHLGKAMGASFGIVAATYTIIYAIILYAIGEIPFVGWLIDLAIVLADIFGGFSDKLTGWLMKAFGPKDDAIVEGWLEDVGMPSISILDKDRNGLDVGDRITVELNTTSKVNVTAGSQLSSAQSSWYRPYITIEAPPGSFSNTSATGVPLTSSMNITTGSGWKIEQYETGAWIEPGVGMPNFPVGITLNINYYLRHDWHHWILFVPCYHHDAQQGTTSTPFTTVYYDVLPATIDDFGQWRGVTPLDHDGDGIADVNETNSNAFRYDTDADGLNDKYETEIGLNPSNFDTDMDGLIDGFELTFDTNGTNPDTDGDGLPDYQELSGYLISFNYLNDTSKPFQMRVFSDPRVADTDGDGIDDYMEYLSGLNPHSADTDGDGVMDVAHPRIEKTIVEFVNSTEITSDIGGLYDIAVDKNGYVYVFGQAGYTERSETDTASHLWIYDSNLSLVSVWNITDVWPTGQVRDCIAIDDRNGLIHFGNYYLDVPADYADRANIKTYYLNGTQIGDTWASKSDIEMWQPLNFDVDSEGNIYVARSSAWFDSTLTVYVKTYVDEYGANRSLLKTWGSYGLELDKFTNIRDIAVDTNYSRIYVADIGQNMTWLVPHSDRADRVAVFDINGNYIRSINGFNNGTLAIPFDNPTGVDVDSEGYVYVADSGNYRIHKFDPYGIPLVSWGGNGTAEDQFELPPTRLAVDSQDNVYVISTALGVEDVITSKISKFAQSSTPPEPIADEMPDRDGDGLLNTVETAGWDVTFTNATGTFTVHVDSDPMLKDTDFDGLSDDVEHSLGLNPRSPDSDGDGVSDLTEYEWHHSPGMNPLHFDTDGDGLDDAAELAYGSNPTVQDTDGDGLTDLQEFQLNTNPAKIDTDGDGLSDYQEIQFGSDPLNPDSDSDFLFDGAEKIANSDPQSPDSDNDGLPDGEEVLFGISPISNDTDHDGLNDSFDVDNCLNPLSSDTDGDGVSDLVEITNGTNPWLGDSDFDGVPDNGDLSHVEEETNNIELQLLHRLYPLYNYELASGPYQEKNGPTKPTPGPAPTPPTPPNPVQTTTDITLFVWGWTTFIAVEFVLMSVLLVRLRKKWGTKKSG